MFCVASPFGLICSLICMLYQYPHATLLHMLFFTFFVLKTNGTINAYLSTFSLFLHSANCTKIYPKMNTFKAITIMLTATNSSYKQLHLKLFQSCKYANLIFNF